MIDRNNVTPIGRLQKTFGIAGAITLLYEHPAYCSIHAAYYFLEIESIFVPFFIEEITFSNDTLARVKFEGIENQIQAARYTHLPVYLPRKMVAGTINSQETLIWDYFVGFSVFNQHLQELGVIQGVDSSTINVLFAVQKGKEEFLIPATEDFVTKIDDEKKIIYLNLPEGLIE